MVGTGTPSSKPLPRSTCPVPFWAVASRIWSTELPLALGVADPEDIARDLDEVALELALVPLVEHVGELGIGEPAERLEHVVAPRR